MKPIWKTPEPSPQGYQDASRQDNFEVATCRLSNLLCMKILASDQEKCGLEKGSVMVS